MISASNRTTSNGHRLRSRTLPAARKLSTRTPRRSVQTSAFLEDKNGKKRKELRAKVCIIGSGPAAHTAAIYTSRAELDTALFEGWMANGIAPGGQLTTTTYVENFPGFPKPILGIDLVMNMREQSATYGTQIYTETINSVDFQQYPFKLYTDDKEVTADAVIVATGASARKLKFPGETHYASSK
jgi:thioredoxin reductase (NADPH)